MGFSLLRLQVDGLGDRPVARGLGFEEFRRLGQRHRRRATCVCAASCERTAGSFSVAPMALCRRCTTVSGVFFGTMKPLQVL